MASSVSYGGKLSWSTWLARSSALGARSMMRHLQSLGHKRIAFIKGPQPNADARKRLRGYRAAMGIGAPRELEIDGDFTERSGHAAVEPILKLQERPTAIFAANDSMAVGALSALVDEEFRPIDRCAVGAHCVGRELGVRRSGEEDYGAQFRTKYVIILKAPRSSRRT